MRIHIRRQPGALLVCLLLGVFPGAAAAQVGPPWPGDRVRVSQTDACWRNSRVGRLVSLGPDSLVLSVGRGASETRLALPRRAVGCLERGQQAGTYILRGTVLGLLAGAAGGAGAIAIMAANACADCWGAVLLLPAAVGGGAAVGAVVGAVVGDAQPRIEWRQVPLAVRVGVGPTRNGGLMLRLTLR